MKYRCDVVRDLLPLYVDDVASPASRQMVEEHLTECAECGNVLARLRDREVEEAVSGGREEVLAGQRRFFARRSALIGSAVAGLFAVPVPVCLAVNLISGQGLGWFFIVLAALLVAASLLVVPFAVPEDRGLWTAVSFTISLVLLLGACCLYSGGRWFFVAASSVLFGLSAVLLPFFPWERLLPDLPEKHRGTAVMAADTFFFVLMMLAIGSYAKAPGFYPLAAAISLPVLIAAWCLYFFLRRRGWMPLHPIRQGSPEGTQRRLKPWEILVLTVGAPLWISLLAAALAVLLSVFVSIWVVAVALWAADASLAAGALAAAAAGLWSLGRGDFLRGIAALGAGSVMAGLSVFLFFGCRAGSRGAAELTGKMFEWAGRWFPGRRDAQ